MFVDFAARRPIHSQRSKSDMDGCIFDMMSRRTITVAMCLLALVLGTTAQAQIKAPSATDTSVTLTWTAPGDDGSVGTASLYDLRYSLSPINASTFNQATQVSGEPTPKVAGSAETFNVNGLNSNTTYYFAIKAVDDKNNWSALSNVVSKATNQETTAPANITNLVAGSATEISITLTWTAPGDDGATGTASSYDIRYSTSPVTAANFAAATQATGEPAPTAAGTQQNFVVTGLTTGTTYYFAMKTADEAPNWSGLSNVVGHTTASDVTAPAAVNDLAALTGPNYGSIELVFTTTGADGFYGMASDYEIRVGQTILNDLNWNSAQLIANPPDPLPAGSSQRIVVDSLTPGQTYFVGLKVWDATSNSSSISNISFAEANVNLSLDIDDDEDGLPSTYTLDQNYPNPFNPSTQIAYSLPHASHVNLTVYNVNGQLVRTLVDEFQQSGNHEVTWQGDNVYGRSVATGMYFYRLVAEDFSQTKKMVLVK